MEEQALKICTLIPGTFDYVAYLEKNTLLELLWLWTLRCSNQLHPTGSFGLIIWHSERCSQLQLVNRCYDYDTVSAASGLTGFEHDRTKSMTWERWELSASSQEAGAHGHLDVIQWGPCKTLNYKSQDDETILQLITSWCFA